MRRAALPAGVAALVLGWSVVGQGMTGHMAAHMIAVAVAAPLLALAAAGTRADPAARWPSATSPLAAMLAEAAVVWGWHLPAARALAATVPGLLAEQAMFLGSGYFLWAAVLGTRHADLPRRAQGVAALLLTSMHMTLLGALVGLAPRPLYGHAHAGFGLDSLADQQLAGVVMLAIGGAAYMAGGLTLLARLLRQPEHAA